LAKRVDEGELVGYVVNGVDGTYNNGVATVHGNPNTTLDDLYDKLSAHDRHQFMLQDSGGTFTSSINLALRGCYDNRGPRRNDDNHGTGR
jgi:hypothetical protein